MELTPREVGTLVDWYQEAIQTAVATWPRTSVTEKRLQAMQARLAALLALDAAANPLDPPSPVLTPPASSRVLSPDGRVSVPV